MNITRILTSRIGRSGAARTILSGYLLILTGVGASCTGPKYHVNDVVLSDLPLQDKERMLAVQGEVNQAAEEKNKAQADVAVDARDIDVAEAEHSQARLETDKLEAEVRLAERGQDLNRIRPAKAKLTELNGRKSLTAAKLGWLEHRRDYHRTLVEVAGLHGTAAQRRYELEKARLAQSSGKLPNKNFNLAQFEGQAAQAQQKYDEARRRADKQQMETGQLEQAYSQMQPHQ
jgi:hypothetical protein